MNLLTMRRPGEEPYQTDDVNDGELYITWSLQNGQYVVEMAEVVRQLYYKISLPAWYPAGYPVYRRIEPWWSVISALSYFGELRKMLVDFPLDAVEPPKEKP